MFGVMDGHGINGHHVSEMVKKTMPATLANLINRGNGYDLINPNRKSLVSAKRAGKKNTPGSRNPN